MSKGKRLVLALVLLVTFCTVAIAASPKVDSILQEHDVLVPFFLPRTLFTITPQGDDVTWSISRKNGDEWEDATVSWDQYTPLRAESARTTVSSSSGGISRLRRQHRT